MMRKRESKLGICVKCKKKKLGNYYRRIAKGGIMEFYCNDCTKKRFNKIESKLRWLFNTQRTIDDFRELEEGK